MLCTVLIGWQRVPLLAVVFKANEFMPFAAKLLTDGNTHARVSVLARCQCVVSDVMIWLSQRRDPERMRVSLAYLHVRHELDDYRMSAHELRSAELDSFDPTRDITTFHTDAYCLEMANVPPECSCECEQWRYEQKVLHGLISRAQRPYAIRSTLDGIDYAEY